MMSIAQPSMPPATATGDDNLFAAVDMGTNSFKMTVVGTDPDSGRFLTLNRLKEPVRLGLDISHTSSASAISSDSLNHGVSAIRKFQNYLRSRRLPPSHLRVVATSAVREASNRSQFIRTFDESLGLNVDVLSGDEEARLVYLGVLQFFPVFNSTVLTVDIGGGSTEFTVGFRGNVLYSKSLRLGHVTLTQEFDDITKMREHIRDELETSGLVQKIKEFKLDTVIGSSGTIKAIDRAVSKGYALQLDENGLFEEFAKTEWRFSKKELRALVETLSDDDKETGGKLRREQFFKDRAGYILAGTVLLDEICTGLGIEEIEVSGYALGEGVVSDMLSQARGGSDLSANARWRSVMRLATRFNNKKRMKAATMYARITRELFEGLRKLKEFHDNGENEFWGFLDDMDLEYLDAACLLHNIGMYCGKKGYHKQSYHAIMNGDHLSGYSREESKFIAMLVRYHRKKFPKGNALEGFAKEVKKKFQLLCTIMRISYALQQCVPADFQVVKFIISSSQGIKLVVSMDEKRNQSGDIVQQQLSLENINSTMEPEFEHLGKLLKRECSIEVIETIY